MIRIEDKCTCCGCGACASLCPKHCISMRMDGEGFLYPNVVESECVHCGICTKCCPVLQKEEGETVETPLAYVAYHEDIHTRLQSSSGGIFSLLAQTVLSENGLVFGAAFDETFHVHHIGISSEKELYKLRGSKYIQSRMGDVYEKVKRALDSGKKVLFTGTACQIAGINNYLGKEYDNLITADVLCHGVPSANVWQKYLDEQQAENHSKIKEIYFRHKSSGWKHYSFMMQFENGKVYTEVYEKNTFMKLFLSDICLRPSCHHCKFKGISRCSDITMGDAWGVESYMPEMDDDKGTSVLLIHTEKGKKLFDEINENLVYRQADINQLLPPASAARRPVLPHIFRSKFFRQMQKGKSIRELSLMTRTNLFSILYDKGRKMVNKKYRCFL